MVISGELVVSNVLVGSGQTQIDFKGHGVMLKDQSELEEVRKLWRCAVHCVGLKSAVLTVSYFLCLQDRVFSRI